jgi:hypothetical protein
LVYLVGFTVWFKPRTIQIFHTERTLPARWRLRRPAATPNLTFFFNTPLRLTDIKVVSLYAWQTNHQVLPLWHLVSDSNSAPVKVFFYGVNLRGMRPFVSDMRAAPLATNVVYRLLVAAGKIHGWHDFELGGQPPGEASRPAR